MNWDLQGWPASARTAVLSLVVIAVAYVIGRVAKYIVATQLVALARRTGTRWIDPIVEAVARRVPFWSVLVGIYIAAGFWILPEKIAIALDKGLYVVAAASLTFLVVGSARQARPHPRAGDRSLAADDDAHREPRTHRRRHPRLARHPGRTRPADYADSDGSRRRRSCRRSRAAGHARESVCGFLSDGRKAHPHRQLHQAVVWRGRISRRHRLAREPSAAVDEQHRARAERQVVAVDRHQLRLARSRDRRHDRGERRLCERSRSAWNASRPRSRAT